MFQGKGFLEVYSLLHFAAIWRMNIITSCKREKIQKRKKNQVFNLIIFIFGYFADFETITLHQL